MILKTRGKKIELFSVDEFIDFLEENSYNFNKVEAIEFFKNNAIREIQLSKLPFKKVKIKQKTEQKIEPKNKIQEFIEKSKCSEKAIEYLKKEKLIVKAFSQPPMRFQQKTLYYGYLPRYDYYFLVIQNEFNYFKGFEYQIIDKKDGYYFDLYYIKISILKKYFDDRKILNIDNMCHFEGFKKKVIDKIPNQPILTIDFMEELI